MRRYESDYFRDAFLINYLKLKSDWSELDHSFDHLAEVASKAESLFLLHRDFQSRNIIISDSDPDPQVPGSASSTGEPVLAPRL
jgi:aminoglycoside/choline kinase family phosphotransferase